MGRRATGEALRRGPPLIGNAHNDLMISAASFWEIAIKRSLGRDDFKVRTLDGANQFIVKEIFVGQRGGRSR